MIKQNEIQIRPDLVRTKETEKGKIKLKWSGKEYSAAHACREAESGN